MDRRLKEEWSSESFATLVSSEFFNKIKSELRDLKDYSTPTIIKFFLSVVSLRKNSFRACSSIYEEIFLKVGIFFMLSNFQFEDESNSWVSLTLEILKEFVANKCLNFDVDCDTFKSISESIIIEKQSDVKPAFFPYYTTTVDPNYNEEIMSSLKSNKHFSFMNSKNPISFLKLPLTFLDEQLKSELEKEEKRETNSYQGYKPREYYEQNDRKQKKSFFIKKNRPVKRKKTFVPKKPITKQGKRGMKLIDFNDGVNIMNELRNSQVSRKRKRKKEKKEEKPKIKKAKVVKKKKRPKKIITNVSNLRKTALPPPPTDLPGLQKIEEMDLSKVPPTVVTPQTMTPQTMTMKPIQFGEIGISTLKTPQSMSSPVIKPIDTSFLKSVDQQQKYIPHQSNPFLKSSTTQPVINMDFFQKHMKKNMENMQMAKKKNLSTKGNITIQQFQPMKMNKDIAPIDWKSTMKNSLFKTIDK